MTKVTPTQIDAARRLVRERRAGTGEIAELWGVHPRTVTRYLYEADLPGTTEPLLESPGNTGEHWWMRGEDHHNATLTKDQVVAVWNLQGVLSAAEVVRVLGLPVDESGAAVHRIWSGHNWRWLTEKLPPREARA